MCLKTLIILLATQTYVWGTETNNLTVYLAELGCVQGTSLPGYQTKQFDAFLGVPFAEPPTGPLRFKNPLPVRPWNNVLQTKLQKSDCIQKNYLLDDWFVTGDEDCLYMNIYRPEQRSEKPLPVMFYIFGGGLFCGSASPDMLDPSYFMDTQEVIVVVTNYRLGPFGFLSTGTLEMPGNLGLKDQQLALKWVQTHIASFGGDPKSITLFGHSAGASSVHFHMLAEGSKDLFHAGILGSGNALGPYVDIIREPFQQVLKLAEHLEIESAADLEIKQLVEMLQAFDSYTLLIAGDALKSWHSFPMFNFGPIIEQADWPNAFLTESPKKLMENGKILQVPTLHSLVSNRGEGAVYTLRIWTHDELREEFNSNFNERLWSLMELPLEVSEEKRHMILNSVVDEYFGGVSALNNSTIIGFTELFSDLSFYHPFWQSTKYTLQHTSSSAPLYVAKFNYNGPYSHSFLYNGGAPINYGLVHMDDVLYLFRAPAVFPVDFEKDSNDAHLVNELVTLYVDFAKNGEVKDLNACTADAFNAHDSSSICDYIEFFNRIGTGYTKVVHNEFNTERMEMWDKILKNQL